MDSKMVQLEKKKSGTEKRGGFEPWIRNQVIPGTGGTVLELHMVQNRQWNIPLSDAAWTESVEFKSC
jgi:hypothetical protein